MIIAIAGRFAIGKKDLQLVQVKAPGEECRLLVSGRYTPDMFDSSN
jgi:hypothetical protein